MTESKGSNCPEALILLTLCLLAAPAHALIYPPMGNNKEETKLGIAAIVNDDIISTLDLEERITLVIGTAGLSGTPEVRARLQPQILRALIDEKLQLQEAERAGIEVSGADVAQAIATIEQQRGKPAGSLKKHLQENRLPVSSFEQQLKTQIAWSKLVIKKLRPRVRIGDEELQAARERLAKTPSDEVEIVSILLPVESPDQSENVRKLADKLTAEIKGGASFDAVVSQLSSKAAQGGGEPIRVRLGEIDPALAKAVGALAEGQITPPVRTPAGYQIVKLLGRSKGLAPVAGPAEYDSEVALKRILLSLKQDAEAGEATLLLDIAKQVAKAPGSCQEKGIAGLEDTKTVEIEVKHQRTRLSALPEKLQELLGKTVVGATTEPFATSRGLELVMLCEKIEMPDVSAIPLPPAEKVKSLLYQQKMELEATKFMRNLRREAFVDIRTK